MKNSSSKLSAPEDTETFHKDGTRIVKCLADGLKVQIVDFPPNPSTPPLITGEAVSHNKQIKLIVLKWHEMFRDKMSLTDYLSRMFSESEDDAPKME